MTIYNFIKKDFRKGLTLLWKQAAGWAKFMLGAAKKFGLLWAGFESTTPCFISDKGGHLTSITLCGLWANILIQIICVCKWLQKGFNSFLQAGWAKFTLGAAKKFSLTWAGFEPITPWCISDRGGHATSTTLCGLWAISWYKLFVFLNYFRKGLTPFCKSAEQSLR